MAETLTKNTAWVMLGQICGTVLAAAGSILIARSLGPNDYGVKGIVEYVVGLLIVLTSLGMESGTTRFVAEFNANQPHQIGKLVNYILKVRLAIIAPCALLLFFLANFLSFYVFNKPDMGFYLQLSILSILPAMISAIFESALSGFQRFGTLTKIGIVNGVSWFFLTAGLLYLGHGLTGVIISNMINSVAFLVIYYYIFKAYKHRINDDSHAIDEGMPFTFQTRRRIVKYSTVTFLISLVNYIVWFECGDLFLGMYRTSAETGYYDLAIGFSSKVLSFIPTALLTSLFPFVTNLYAKNSISEMKLAYSKSLLYIALGVAPLSVFLFAFSNEIISVLFTTAFLSATPLLQILAVSSISQHLANSQSVVLYSMERQDFLLKVGAALAVAEIALFILTVPTYGALGATLVTATTQIFFFLAETLYVNRLLKGAFPLISMLKVASSAVVTGIILSILKPFFASTLIDLIISALITLAIYLLLLPLFRVFDASDITLVDQIFSGKFLPFRKFVKKYVSLRVNMKS